MDQEDQEDQEAIRLLCACRAAVATDGRVIIVERVIPAGNTSSLSQLSDLMSLVVTGGRIGSEDEFDQLFNASGRAALPQRALQGGPEAGRSSVPSLMDNRCGKREDGQEPLVR